MRTGKEFTATNEASSSSMSMIVDTVDVEGGTNGPMAKASQSPLLLLPHPTWQRRARVAVVMPNPPRRVMVVVHHLLLPPRSVNHSRNQFVQST